MSGQHHELGQRTQLRNLTESNENPRTRPLLLLVRSVGHADHAAESKARIEPRGLDLAASDARIVFLGGREWSIADGTHDGSPQDECDGAGPGYLAL